MEATIKKTVNKVKGTIKQRRGPAEKDHATVPIADCSAGHCRARGYCGSGWLPMSPSLRSCP